MGSELTPGRYSKDHPRAWPRWKRRAAPSVRASRARARKPVVSEPLAEEVGPPRGRPGPEGPRVPALGDDLLAVGQVVLEHHLEGGGEALVLHDRVGLEVVAERLLIEVRRAHGGPAAVDDRRLGVEDAPLPLEHADAGAEEDRVDRA